MRVSMIFRCFHCDDQDVVDVWTRHFETTSHLDPSHLNRPFMVFVGASVLNLCLFDQKTWGNDTDVLGTVVLSCCIRRPGPPNPLVDDLVIQQYSLSQNVSNNNLKFSFILRQIMDSTHHQTWDLQERLDSLMNGRTPWLLGSGEWRSHLPSGYGLAQRMKSSWPCSKQRFLQRNPESSRNDSNLIHSWDKMNKNATRSPGLLV